LIAAGFGLFGPITAAIISTRNEHRLTVLEENRLSKEDKACIREAIVLIRLWFKVYEDELPKTLKNPPGIDGILDIITGDLSAVNTKLSVTDQAKLVEYLESRACEEEDSEMRFRAKLLLGMVRLKMDESWKDKSIANLRQPGVC